MQFKGRALQIAQQAIRRCKRKCGVQITLHFGPEKTGCPIMKIQEGDLEVELIIQFWTSQIQMTMRYLSRDSKKEFGGNCQEKG